MSEAVDDPTANDPIANDPSGRTGDPATTVESAAHVDDCDASVGEIDLAGIEADFDGVQAALARLADGTYWTDEVTGAPIAADILVSDPLTRRA